jgi:hypothetical protein
MSAVMTRLTAASEGTRLLAAQAYARSKQPQGKHTNVIPLAVQCESTATTLQ